MPPQATMSASEEGMGPLQRGRKRYQERDYAGAVAGFTEAVDMSTDHLLLKALDGRAASYEKLDKLQLALRDAKEMIDLSPKVSKGYLRCGKILQLKKQSPLALKIYERGLTKVKIGTDEERTTLQTMYTKLRMELNPGKSLDPLQYLPLELAQMVCQNLEMRDRVICLSVTKAWKKLLESSYDLWTTFDTTKARKALSDRSFRAHLKRSNYTLDRAIFSMRSVIDLKKMQLLTRACKNLREIRIHGSGSIGESLYEALPDAKKLETIYVSRETEITLSSVQKVMEVCKATLINASFLNIQASTGGFIANRWPTLPSLQYLTLRANIGDACLDLHGLRDNTPSLITAILNDWRIMPMSSDLTSWNRLERLDLTNTQLRVIPQLPTSLRHLIMADNHHLRAPADETAAGKIYVLPLLETFNCSSTNIDAPALRAITKQTIERGNLKTLLIRDMDSRQPVLFYTALPPSETVEVLSVAALRLTDVDAITISEMYPNLRTLDLSDNYITGVAVRNVVKNGVRRLLINGCHDISPDAVEWARGQAVEVAHAMNSAPLSRAQQITHNSGFY